jgi:hypothetical protein
MSAPFAAAAAIIVAVGLAAPVAGCGGGTPGGATSSGSPTSQPLAFSRCMCSHGAPTFPDPNSSGVWPKSQVEIAAGNPRFQAARLSTA